MIGKLSLGTSLSSSRDMLAGPGHAYAPEWRSSIALYAYAPPVEANACDPVVYLKVAATITGYELTDDEFAAGHCVLRNSSVDGRVEVFARDWTRRYMGCYSALFEVSVGPGSGTWDPGSLTNPADMSRWPHIVGVAPENREVLEPTDESGSFTTRSQALVTTTGKPKNGNSGQSLLATRTLAVAKCARPFVPVRRWAQKPLRWPQPLGKGVHRLMAATEG